jgi:hypothetical protein
MSAADLDTIEKPFYYLGLNTIPKRFLAGTFGTGALLYGLKPDAMFYSDGTPRSWKLTDSAEGSTAIPWWLLSVAVGTVLATFI